MGSEKDLNETSNLLLEEELDTVSGGTEAPARNYHRTPKCPGHPCRRCVDIACKTIRPHGKNKLACKYYPETST